MQKRLFILFTLFASLSFGQQISLNTQYMFNEMLVNPGATGSKDYIPVQVMYRKQWVNFPGSPTTQAVSCHSQIFDKMGFGGFIFNDAAGPSRRTGININGAYHLKLDRRYDHKLGIGMSLSLAQHMIDVNQLTTYLPDDPAVLRGYNNQVVPDAHIGAFYHYKDIAFAGLSAQNLVQTNRDLFADVQVPFTNPLVRTYYLMGGYNLEMNQDFGLKATGLVQMIETFTTQFDVSLLGVYRNSFWFGAAYRHTDAVSALIGGQLGRLKLGYAYDYTLSDIGDYSTGSHEVFIECKFYSSDGNGRRSFFRNRRNSAPKI